MYSGEPHSLPAARNSGRHRQGTDRRGEAASQGLPDSAECAVSAQDPRGAGLPPWWPQLRPSLQSEVEALSEVG